MAAVAAQHRPSTREEPIHFPPPAASSGAIVQSSVTSIQATSDGVWPSSPQDDFGSPVQEVTLSKLHERSRPLCLSSNDLAQGLDSARRLDALEWLVQAFDALTLSDSQLFSAFGLLDRFAAASPQPISAGPGAFAYVLAAMLVALKVSGTQKDLERAKRLVVEASGTQRPWPAVRKAEMQILRRLQFKACTPTCLDFLERMLNEVFSSTSSSSSDCIEPESRIKCGELARLLLELGIVHEPEAVYGSGYPPLVSAIAALLLALLTFRVPAPCTEVLREHLRLLDVPDTAVVDLAEAMRTRWLSEERKTSVANANSAVLQKWKRRGSLGVGVSVPTSADMKQILPDALRNGVKAAEDVELSGLGRRLRGKQAVSPIRARDLAGIQVAHGIQGTILAPPTAVLRGGSGPSSGSSAANDQAASKLQVANNSSLAIGARREVLEAPSLAGLGLTITAGKYPPSQLVSAFSRNAASENLAAWPHTTSTHSQEAPPSPHLAPAKAAQGATKGAAMSTGHGQVARPDDRSPEPLVELTHVLNMVHPSSTRPPHAGSGPTGGTASSTKPKPPSVASELLVSSALRLAWPPDRRKGVDVGVAAGSCREAAAVLEEAAQYLRQTAANLDSGILQVNSANGLGSETKRRKTFGGPSPPRALSPPADIGARSTTLTRGIPPVVRGIRV